ncbi:Uncharacterised protein [Mycobacteroides abscessus subsp. abscessus]|nr:Uncharacterised protein [Mycobacteroides abscessus subsp. abscessus]
MIVEGGERFGIAVGDIAQQSIQVAGHAREPKRISENVHEDSRFGGRGKKNETRRW